MLIWTTTGPKRAEKTAEKQPSEEAFAESSLPKTPGSDDDKTTSHALSADVFIDRPGKPEHPAAADDADWSSAETPRVKAPESTE